jgi:uncharacterized protein YyaL (SSP411 family)
MRTIKGLPAILAAAAISSVTGCAGPGASTVRAAAPAAPASASLLAEGAPREPLAWADLTAATLSRAKVDRKFVVLDGSAEWCHWCHVMEATTYHDPRVREILARHFVAVKVDVDARPDVEERYGDWGWPATVIFSPDATELGKYRGYIPPEKFVEILEEVVAGDASRDPSVPASPKKPRVASTPMPEEEIAWILRFTEVELDEYYDEKEGGWGHTQKAPLGWDNAWALSRARSGDAGARARVLVTLDKQAALVDPVWGGIYQYSAAADWNHAHFEKLMPFQAGALENYAEAYALTRDAKYLHLARTMQSYVDEFLTSPEGAFYATQDADLNAHDASKPFLSGHDYYAMDDVHRRAAGIPRVDAHEYGKDNALAISAYVTLHEATGDTRALGAAERAARRVLATHATARGGISHDVVDGAPAPRSGAREGVPRGPVLHLADNAAFAFALVRLHEATHDAFWLDRARAVADFLLRELEDAEGGGFFASTADPDAVGVFAARRTPFEDNVMALRVLARIARLEPSRADYRRAIGRTIRAIATPEEIKGRGRMLGDFLMALEESKGVR